VTLHVPARGGHGRPPGARARRREPAGAGKLTLALRLTSATLRHRRHAHTVKLRVDVRFTPVGGTASELRVTVTCDGSV
jgi:hypothetical protein